MSFFFFFVSNGILIVSIGHGTTNVHFEDNRHYDIICSGLVDVLVISTSNP